MRCCNSLNSKYLFVECYNHFNSNLHFLIYNGANNTKIPLNWYLWIFIINRINLKVLDSIWLALSYSNRSALSLVNVMQHLNIPRWGQEGVILVNTLQSPHKNSFVRPIPLSMKYVYSLLYVKPPYYPTLRIEPTVANLKWMRYFSKIVITNQSR